MLGKDKADKSLENYKKTLLKGVDLDKIAEEQEPEVEILKVEFVCKGRPDGPISLDFSSGEEQKVDPEKFYMKEASTFHTRVTFKVHNDIVYGLKFANIVKKMGMQVDKSEEILGTFAPTDEPHVAELESSSTPEGWLKRGDYAGKAMILDSDGNCLLYTSPSPRDRG